jgi:dipeptidyl-peptidase 4
VIVVDEKRGLVYFTASREKSTETQLYCVGLNGKNLKILTRAGGTHNVKISPAGKYFIDTYSSVNQPAKMELWSTNDKMIRALGDAYSPALAEYQLGQAELFTIPASDGLPLPAVWVLPANLDKSKKYPVLISIYGGPASPTVSNSWQGLRPHYYSQNGIIYLSVDHRGSGHFGKEGVTLMHRRLGHWEMKDYIDAVKWLRRQPFVDSTRIAITGGSYGGYVSCLALTYAADYFTHGVAEFSVTDYRLYDSIYTERYMDAPLENSTGYDSTAVMKWVDRYKGLLRITHGTLDDNVHMQNSIQLIDKLQDAGKHFELMLYPNSRHGYGAGKNRHAGEESIRFWFKNLLNKEWSAEE